MKSLRFGVVSICFDFVGSCGGVFGVTRNHVVTFVPPTYDVLFLESLAVWISHLLMLVHGLCGCHG